MKKTSAVMTTTRYLERIQRRAFFKGVVWGLLIAGAALLYTLYHESHRVLP